MASVWFLRVATTARSARKLSKGPVVLPKKAPNLSILTGPEPDRYKRVGTRRHSTPEIAKLMMVAMTGFPVSNELLSWGTAPDIGWHETA